MAYIEIWSPNKHGTRMKKNIIVIHTNEPGPYAYNKFPGTAESLGRYLQQSSVQASYQINVDRNGDLCRMVKDADAAWAAGPIANNEGLHLCFLGWAQQSRDEWLSFPKQLDAGAKVVADWCRQEGIPAEKLSAAQFKAAKWGVGGHGDVAKAWGETNHTDPGVNFPFDILIAKVKAILNPAAPAPAPAPQQGGQGMSAEMIQWMGEKGDGWAELVPQKNAEGKSFSIFKFLRGAEPNVKKQTVVEAIATLVFEATLRINPYRKGAVNRVPETVLGHAAASVGVGLDNQEMLVAVMQQQQRILEGLKLPRSTEIDKILNDWYRQDANKDHWLNPNRKIDALDPAWTPPTE